VAFTNMLYNEPFVIYLNICICIILLLLVVPTLLNTKEEFKVRFAFALVFLTVITNCTTNVIVFLYHNYNLLPIVFFLFFIPLLFGPAVLYYVKGVLGHTVHKNIIYSFIPGVISFVYGIYLTCQSSQIKQQTLQVIIDGNQHVFNALNLITLFYILLYCVKSWVFLKRLQINPKDTFYQQTRLKKAWAKEFVLYIFGHVFVFFFIHSAVVAKLIPISTIDLELVWMPIFMLMVYLLIAIRSTMMYKEFEHQFVLAKIESERKIQEQRMEIARDLHDSLGAQLTLINSVTDNIKNSIKPSEEALLQKIERLSYFSEKSITELKNALWVLSADEIMLADFRSQLANFISKIIESNPDLEIVYTFDIQKNTLLDTKQAAHLFRIIQEFINNSMKYAQTDKLWILIDQDNEKLQFELRDNGIGFDPNVVKENSYGIANLQHRVQSMAGSFQLDTALGKGTCYKITVNINQ
jgi:signal transduction histidine kinase